MEIILLLGYIPIVAYLFWQSYLLNILKKLADQQHEEIKRLKPFQFSQSLPFGVAIWVGSPNVTIELRTLKKVPEIPTMSVVVCIIGL